MELKNPFLEIKRLRERIQGDDITDSFSEPLDPLDVIKIELEQGEIQVDRKQIIQHGPFLLYEGKILAILYIYDYRATQEDLLSESVDKKAPKFHFSWCRTLSDMDKKGKYLKKVFYYDYKSMEGIDFPNSITEINYLETKDSIISKTKFSNFMFDRELDREMLEFEIPESAILVNR